MDKLKQYSVLEVVLLVIFAVGLGLSLALVQVRSRVTLSEPVALPLAGLSASLPSGNDWETAGGWRYETDNAYVLLAGRGIPGKVVMTVRWRYALCNETMSADAWLEQRAKAVGGLLEPLGTAPGKLAMRYGRIFGADESGREYLVGTTELDLGRRLELHITYLTDARYAENAFAALAETVTYEPPAALTTGARAIEEFFSETLEQIFAPDADPPTAFLISNAARRPVGYAVRRYFAYANGDDGHRRVSTRHLDGAGVYTESDVWLPKDETLSWTTQMWMPNASQPNHTELRINEKGRITVQTNVDKWQTLERTPMMLPDIFLAEFAAARADAAEPVIVDLLTGEGVVVPTRVAVVDQADSPIQSEEPVLIVRVEYLHTEKKFDDFAFNADGRLIGRYEQEPRRPGLLWDVATPERLKQIFGEYFEPRARQAVRVWP